MSSNRALARLQMLSEITPHLYGPGEPPKVSQSKIIASSLSSSLVIVCTAVSQFRWQQQYADL
jgi:hypothetical protein